MRTMVALILMLWSGAATAGAMADMDGRWSGSGKARQDVARQMEPVRCSLRAAWTAAEAKLVIDGLCAAAGRRFRLAGTVRRGQDGALGGRWDNPDGTGSASLVGTETAGALRFTVTPPIGVDRRPRQLEWSFAPDGTLRFDAALRDLADGTLASILFKPAR